MAGGVRLLLPFFRLAFPQVFQAFGYAHRKRQPNLAAEALGKCDAASDHNQTF